MTAEVGILQHQAIGKIDHKQVIDQYHCDDSYHTTKLTSTTTNAVCIVFDSTSEMIGLGHNEELFCTLHILRASSGASWLSQTKEESLPTTIRPFNSLLTEQCDRHRWASNSQ